MIVENAADQIERSNGSAKAFNLSMPALIAESAGNFIAIYGKDGAR